MRTFMKLFGVVSVALLMVPTAAHAELISGAILAFIGIEATATAVAVTTFVLTAVISTPLGGAISILRRKAVKS